MMLLLCRLTNVTCVTCSHMSPPLPAGWYVTYAPSQSASSRRTCRSSRGTCARWCQTDARRSATACRWRDCRGSTCSPGSASSRSSRGRSVSAAGLPRDVHVLRASHVTQFRDGGYVHDCTAECAKLNLIAKCTVTCNVMTSVR